MADAEVNIDLNISFSCPHCESVLLTRDHGFVSSIESGVHDLVCEDCKQSFELRINESY
jgi:transcription elongation factor Elf1